MTPERIETRMKAVETTKRSLMRRLETDLELHPGKKERIEGKIEELARTASVLALELQMDEVKSGKRAPGDVVVQPQTGAAKASGSKAG